MNRSIRLSALAAVLAAGIAAAALITAPSASAWDINNLPPGYTVTAQDYGTGDYAGCHKAYEVEGYGYAVLLGYGLNDAGQDCDPTFQAQLDAFITRTCPCGPSTSTAATTNTDTTTPSPGGLDLPPGYSVSNVTYPNGSIGCLHAYEITGYGQSITLGYGNDGSGQPCNPNFQSQLDAFVNGTCPCRQTTTTATTTVSAPSTTTNATTTAPAAATVATTTATQTITVTTTVADPTLVARVTTLEQQYAALAARVTAISDANQAAWQTFADDIAAGMDTASAALDARSAALNALYELN